MVELVIYHLYKHVDILKHFKHLKIVYVLCHYDIIFVCLKAYKNIFIDAASTLNEIDKDQLRKFLREGHLTICHSRCIIVGCTGAGKSTFLKRLEGATLKELKSVKETEHREVNVSDFEVLKEKNTIQRNDLHLIYTAVM